MKIKQGVQEGVVKRSGLESETRVLVLALPPATWVTQGKSLYLSELPCPPGNEIISVEAFQCEHSRHDMHLSATGPCPLGAKWDWLYPSGTTGESLLPPPQRLRGGAGALTQLPH